MASFRSMRPSSEERKYDEYVSDPAKPVPLSPAAVRMQLTRTLAHLAGDRPALCRWTARRADLCDRTAYEAAARERTARGESVRFDQRHRQRLGGEADRRLSREVPSNPEMGGYELPIATRYLPGRYRTSFEHPEAITPDKPLLYHFGLPMVNHVFMPGHRIMVQVQSTLFPLYDRNPQTFVPNIFDAKPADYQKATQRIWHTQGDASFISLPIASAQ